MHGNGPTRPYHPAKIHTGAYKKTFFKKCIRILKATQSCQLLNWSPKHPFHISLWCCSNCQGVFLPLLTATEPPPPRLPVPAHQTSAQGAGDFPPGQLAKAQPEQNKKRSWRRRAAQQQDSGANKYDPKTWDPPPPQWSSSVKQAPICSLAENWPGWGLKQPTTWRGKCPEA